METRLRRSDESYDPAISKLTYRLALVVVLASPDWWGALFAYSNTDRSDLDQVGRNLKRKPSKNKIFLSYPGG